MLHERHFRRNKLRVTKDSIIWRGVSYRKRYFLRRVYYYLHARPHLLKKPAYRCLYEESLDLQAEWIWREAQEGEKSLDDYREMIRILADVSVQHNGKNGSNLTRGALNEYLRYRRRVWGCAGRSCTRGCEKANTDQKS